MPWLSDEPTAKILRPARKSPIQSLTLRWRLSCQPELLNTSTSVNLLSHAAVSGGIYVSAKLGTTVPGDTTTGAGSPQMVDVTVQAATWVDVTELEVLVDGQTADIIPITAADADPANPVVRWRRPVPVQTRATGGFVVIAAYGDQPLEPVHPGKMPFGVTEPIFVVP